MEPRHVITAALLAVTLAASAAEAQEMKLTPQIGLGTLTDAPAAADPAFEASTLQKLRGLMPTDARVGDVVLLRKDRGPHPGRYAVFVTAGPSEGRYIFSVAQQFPAVKSYQLVGADRIGPLPTVDVLGVHYIKVQPGKAAAFEKFITDKLNPAVANLRPDLRFLYYKAQDGEYLTIIAVTKASRDKYWPGGADSDDLKTAFTPAVRNLATELQTFLVDGTWGTGMTAQVYEAKDWADWIAIK